MTETSKEKLFESLRISDTHYLFSAKGEIALVDRETLGMLLKQLLPQKGTKHGEQDLGQGPVG